MAICTASATAAFSVLLVVVLTPVCLGELNPEANPICNGDDFTQCRKMMDDFSNLNCSNGTSKWVDCAEMEFKRLKQLDCNDRQRKGALRLVNIYKKSDQVMCSKNPDIMEGVKNISTCWNALLIYGFDELFGAEKCIIPELAETTYNKKVPEQCDSASPKKYLHELLGVSDCTLGASSVTASAALLAVTSLVALAASAIRR